jgi:hypothetical protein
MGERRTREARVRCAAALCAACLLSCGDGLGAATRAVRAYDDALVEAYRMNDASRMPNVATAKETNRAIVLLDLKRSNGIALESTLERIDVGRPERAGPDAAVVDTAERWRYFDRPLSPGRAPGQVFVAEMKMRYALVREDGAWKVDQVRTLSSEYLEPKGYRPGAEHQSRSGER